MPQVESGHNTMTREGQIDLNEAVQHPGRKLAFKVHTDLKQEEDIDLLEPVTGDLVAVSTGNLLLVEAELHTRAVLECARCANPLELEIDFEMSEPFHVEGLPSSYSNEGYAKVVADEPEPMFVENALVLDHFVRQGLLTNLPTQPLCSGDWDIPCPSAPLLETPDTDSGHPAFQLLKSLKTGDKT